MSDYKPNPPYTVIKKPGASKKWLVPAGLAAGGLMIGLVIGTAGASGDTAPIAAPPAPTKTVIEEVEVIDPVCADVARELFSMVETMNNSIAMPQNEVITTLIENLQFGLNLDDIDEATVKIQNVTSTTQNLNGRLVDLTPDYQKCTA